MGRGDKPTDRAKPGGGRRRIRGRVMANAANDQIVASIDAHARSIDELHSKLAATPGINEERLQQAVDKLKTAHQQFHSDALACMN